jgi:putative oxidoreductase
VMHLIVPPGLPAPMAWMYDLPGSLHLLSGTPEILPALALVLTGLTRIAPRLTPLAAVGLVVVIAGALTWHLGRGEAASIVMNLTLAILAAFVAYGRLRLRPLPSLCPA